MVAPTAPQYMKVHRSVAGIGYTLYIYRLQYQRRSSLAFFGQNSRQSGYFAARMMMLLARDEKEIVIFRKIHEGMWALTSKRTEKSVSGST